MSDALIGFVLVFVALAYWEVLNSRNRLVWKLEALQSQLDAIAKQLKVDVSKKVPPEVAGLLQAGRKIEAIKVYRAATGAGLAEAKKSIERMQADLGGTVIQP